MGRAGIPGGNLTLLFTMGNCSPPRHLDRHCRRTATRAKTSTHRQVAYDTSISTNKALIQQGTLQPSLRGHNYVRAYLAQQKQPAYANKTHTKRKKKQIALTEVFRAQSGWRSNARHFSGKHSCYSLSASHLCKSLRAPHKKMRLQRSHSG